MRQPKTFSPTVWRLLAIMLVLSTTFACHSSGSSKTSEQSASAASGTGTTIDVMCIGDRITDPKESFHYSYKYSDDTRSVQDEADITPEKMDVSTKDESGAHSYHAVRSDDTNWGSTSLVLLQGKISVMSAWLDALNGTSSIRPQGAENVNGYATTKYAIDTGSASASDQKQYQELFGKGSFHKGTVWMASDGCTAKLLLDEGVWQQDGSIKKTHYEISRNKK